MASSMDTKPDLEDVIKIAESLGISRKLTEDDWETLVQKMSGVPSRFPAAGSGETFFKNGIEQHAAKIQRYKEILALERATPPEKVPLLQRSLVLQEFDLARAYITNDSRIRFRETFIGISPPHSITPITHLRRLSLSDLFLRQVHKGRYLLCRIINKTSHVVAVNLAVEDPRGNVVKLSLYNYPCTLHISDDDADALFPIGTILAIREPYYKTTVDGKGRMLRLDSPSDLLFIDPKDDLIKDIVWSTGTRPSGAPSLPSSDEDWKKRGASEFKAGRLLCAASCFSEALGLNPEHFLSRLNRAETYLRLGWYNSALHDCEECLKGDINDDGFHRKAVFRAAKSSYNLGQYERTIELTSLRLDDPECKSWRDKAEKRIYERDTGNYDWCSLFKQAQGTAARIDVADYMGPVEVRRREKDGIRGTFATRDIKMGELLMVSKPIACVYPEDNPGNNKEFLTSFNLHTEKANQYSQAALIHALVQKVWDDILLARMVRSLYAGPSLSEPDCIELEGSRGYPLGHARKPVADIDIARIEAIVSYNSFQPHCVSEKPSRFEAQCDLDGGPTAIYFRPSLLNHSCLANSHEHFFGDVIVIRASQNINTGDEITLAYFNGTSSLEKRGESKHWGFECTCELCLADRTDGSEASSLRAQLRNQGSDSLSVREARNLVERIKETYAESPERNVCMTKPDLASAYRALGRAYVSKVAHSYDPDSLVRLIEANWDNLAALGVTIKDRSVRGPFRRSDATSLPIDTDRGPSHLHDICTLTSLMVVRAFNSMGDTRRAKDWMKVAMWFQKIDIGGDKELFLLRFGYYLEYQKVIEIARNVNISWKH